MSDTPTPNGLVRIVERLIAEATGTTVRVLDWNPIAHEVYGRTIARATVDVGCTVIVKRRRDAGEFRAEPAFLRNEITALRFLDDRASRLAPRLVAADDASGLIVMEDLGDGPSLEDVLFADDPSAASDALVTFATGLADLHTATVGDAEAFTRLRAECWPGGFSYARSVASVWIELTDLMQANPDLPRPDHVAADIDWLIATLERPGRFVALSNGDPCPANTRLGADGIRFLDFEHAVFQHASIDVTSLLLPFPSCPCWSLIPADIVERAVAAYRERFARVRPDVLGDDVFWPDAAAACALVTLRRLVRLPKLLREDAPHPVGFSRRGQMLEAMEQTVKTARRGSAIPGLADWLAALAAVLTDAWSSAPMPRPLLPAFTSGE